MSSALNILGIGQHGDFAIYHHVLNRARWSPLQLSRVLLLLVAGRLGSSTEPLVFGIDETVERRWGRKIAAKGRYRDPVRSKDDQVVMTPGLQWVSLMLLTRIGWAGRHWALPFLTALVVSARYDRRKGRRHKTVTDYAQQMLVCLRRWLPDRDLVVVADGGYAKRELVESQEVVSELGGIGKTLTTASSLIGSASDLNQGERRWSSKRMDLLELPAQAWPETWTFCEACGSWWRSWTEVSAQIGAQHGNAPGAGHLPHGYRNRTWDTRVWTWSCTFPSCGKAALPQPAGIRRSEKALLAVIQQAYPSASSGQAWRACPLGGWTDLIKALGCDGISSSQVSRICEQLDEVVESFLGRPLDGGPYPTCWTA